MAYHCPCGGNAASPCGEQCDDLTKRARPPVFDKWILMNISDNSFLGNVNFPLQLHKTETGTAVTCTYYPDQLWEAPKEQDAIRMAKHGLEEMASKRTLQAKPRWMSEWSGRGPTKDDDVASPEATEGVPVPLD